MSLFKKIFSPLEAYEIENFVRDGFMPGVKGKVKKDGIEVFRQREGLLQLTLDSKHHNILKFLRDEKFQFPPHVADISIITYAVLHGLSAAQINTLLDSGVNPYYDRGITPLEAAMDVNADIKVFDLLIRKRIVETSISRPPLIYQVIDNEVLSEDERFELLKRLIKDKCIDVNAKLEGRKALTQELSERDEGVMLYLVIEAGADIRPIARDYGFQYTTEYYRRLSPSILDNQPLLKEEEKLAFLNYKDSLVCLERIAEQGDVTGKELVLSVSTNAINSIDEKIDLCKRVLAMGAAIDEAGDNERRETALQDFCRYFEPEGDFRFHDFLLDNGAEFNANGRSALIHIVRSGQFELLKHLTERGLNITILDGEGHGAFNAFRFPDMVGPLEKRKAMLDYLIEHGLDINQPVTAYTDEEYPSTPLIELLVLAEDIGMLEYVLDTYPQCEVQGKVINMLICRPQFSDDLCMKVIDRNPGHTVASYYKHKVKDTTFTYSAQSIGFAVDYDRFALAERLVDKYPDMKAFTEHESIAYRAFRDGGSASLVEKLIRRDPDLNRLYHLVMGDPSRDSIKMDIMQPAMIFFLSALDDDGENHDEILRFVEVMIDCGADARIPRKKLNQSENYLDDEGAILVATGSHRDTRFLDLLIDKGGVDPNERVSQCLESQIFSLLGNRHLSDEDVVFHYEYFVNKTGIIWEQRDKFDSTLLIEAASNCRAKTTQYLIDQGADIHVTGGFDNAWPMHKAISNMGWLDAQDRADTVEVLLNAGADKEAFDSEDYTPLMSACHYGATACVKVLLAHGVDVNRTNTTNKTAVNVVMNNEFSYDNKDNHDENKTEIMTLLGEQGADVNHVPDEGSTALCDAIGFGFRSVYQRLLQLGADINLADKAGMSPMMVAANFGDIYFCNDLAGNHAPDIQAVDARGENLIHKSIKRAKTEEAAALLEYLFNNGVKDVVLENGMNAFLTTSAYCRHELLPLFKMDADSLTVCDNDGFNACLWAIYSNLNVAEEERIATLETLVKLGIDLTSTDNTGRGAVMWATMLHRYAVLEWLLQQGLDVNQEDEHGNNVICYLVNTYLNHDEPDEDGNVEEYLSDEDYYSGPLQEFSEQLQVLIAAGANPERGIQMAKNLDERESLLNILLSAA